MRAFDAYVFVAWSSSDRASAYAPRADAIWTGELLPTRHAPVERRHRTRRDATAHVRSLLAALAARGARTLVGFDFPYGFPRGLATGLALPAPGWLGLWRWLGHQVSDDAANRNNRFAVAALLNRALGGEAAGPFWAGPERAAGPELGPGSPGFPFQTTSAELPAKRTTEDRLSGTRSPWELDPSSSPGGLALLGIPRLLALRFDPELAPVSAVWPFETGFTEHVTGPVGPRVVHAELRPGVVRERVDALLGSDPELIRDRAQVRALCEWAQDLDEAGALAGAFDRPAGLDDEDARAAFAEEGWILGAGLGGAEQAAASGRASAGEADVAVPGKPDSPTARSKAGVKTAGKGGKNATRKTGRKATRKAGVKTASKPRRKTAPKADARKKAGARARAGETTPAPAEARGGGAPAAPAQSGRPDAARPESDRAPTLDEILAFLNAERVRCTYGAVADVLDVPRVMVPKLLGERLPEHSWVVSKASGEPTGYAPEEKHPELHQRREVIESGEELRAAMRS